ncbi:MAG TPA: hypothetical protein VJ870_17860 [Amycolatopsis sp.]|nr:hypothetical protein [Amycolatopsis sp.]
MTSASTVFDLGAEVIVIEQFGEPARQDADSFGSVLFGHRHDLRLSDHDRSPTV